MPDLASVLEQARVPEHSAPFMQAMSQGTAFLEGEYLFLTADDWLMAIGYPLSGEYAHDSFERALAAALRRVPKRLEGVDCWAIGPDLPARLAGHVTDRDTFYILPCDAPVPARLRRPVEIAAEKLTVREGRDFTPAHRRLWAEFMNRAVLPPNVRGLFARTGAVLDTPGLRLLDAVDAEGNLAASLLLDDAPRRFCSYLIGAHSRTNCTPALPRLWLKRTARCACSTPGIRKVALPPACCWTTRRKNSAPMCSARIPARSIRPTRRTCFSRTCSAPLGKRTRNTSTSASA